MVSLDLVRSRYCLVDGVPCLDDVENGENEESRGSEQCY